MLHFQGHRQKNYRPWFFRRQPMRLALLFVSLAVVLTAMGRLRTPEATQALELMLTGAPRSLAPVVESAARASDPVDLELLATIEDNTFFRDEESPAWFHLLDRLQQEKVSVGASTPSAPVSYAQFVQQPEAYRGRRVSVAGAVRRVERVTPGENALGLEALYRVILQPEGGEVWPLTLYAIDRPDVDLDVDLTRPASAVGYFFKNLSYRWRDGLGVTPVLLVRAINVEPLPKPDISGEPEVSIGWRFGRDALVALALTMAIVGYVAVRFRIMTPSRKRDDS